MAFRDLLHTLGGAASGEAPPEQCIVDHLNWLLNSRRDRHPQLWNYGMPDLHAYLTNPNPDAAIALEVRKVIEQYEPRLARVHVFPDIEKRDFAGRSSTLRLNIEGKLAVDDERREFHETAEITREGNVALR